jgi:hypothetical protein
MAVERVRLLFVYYTPCWLSLEGALFRDAYVRYALAMRDVGAIVSWEYPLCRDNNDHPSKNTFKYRYIIYEDPKTKS